MVKYFLLLTIRVFGRDKIVLDAPPRSKYVVPGPEVTILWQPATMGPGEGRNGQNELYQPFSDPKLRSPMKRRLVVQIVHLHRTLLIRNVGNARR